MLMIYDSSLVTCSYMINPKISGTSKSKCIASPDVGWVQVGNSDVLDNNISDPREAESFSLDSGPVLADQCLL